MTESLHALAKQVLLNHEPRAEEITFDGGMDTRWTRYTVPGAVPMMGLSRHPETHRRAIRTAHTLLYPHRGPRLPMRARQFIHQLCQGDPCTTHLMLRALGDWEQQARLDLLLATDPLLGPQGAQAVSERIDEMLAAHPNPPGPGCVSTGHGAPGHSVAAYVAQMLLCSDQDLAQALQTLRWSTGHLVDFLDGRVPAHRGIRHDLARLTRIPEPVWRLMHEIAEQGMATTRP